MADIDAFSAPAVPAHVPPALVVDFDLWNIPGATEDVQLAMRAVQQRSPDIFWTPRNGGHWVAMRAADIDVIQRDFTRFSNDCYVVPKKPPEIPKELPLECDPPRHTALRRPLTAALMPRQVMALEGRIRALTVELIDKVYARGTCEFIAEIAQALPIFIFLDLVDLPRSDAPILLPIAEQVVHGATPEERGAGFASVRRDLASDTVLAWSDLLQRQIKGHVRDFAASDDISPALVRRLSVLARSCAQLVQEMAFGFLCDPVKRFFRSAFRWPNSSWIQATTIFSPRKPGSQALSRSPKAMSPPCTGFTSRGP